MLRVAERLKITQTAIISIIRLGRRMIALTIRGLRRGLRVLLDLRAGLPRGRR
jgi:hypothetical protein